MLISSFQPLPSARFEGRCFVGADYIAGASGAAVHEAAAGEPIPVGADGCYVVANPVSGGWEIGTDSHGLARLFIYQRGDVWGVGSSVHELARHLRAHGETLHPDLTVLRSLDPRVTLLHQMTTSHSIIEGIRLVPTYQTLRISAAGPVAVDRPRPDVGSYESALAEYIGQWRSRLQTLLEHPEADIAADLSGGLDSRVVFSFLLAAGAQDVGAEQLRLVSNPSKPDDFGPATAIAQAYGMQLNGPELPDRSRKNGPAGLEGWKRTCLGTYLPVYFVERDHHPLSFQAHGAGGGNYRPVVMSGRQPIAAERYEKLLPPRDFIRWRERLEEDEAEFRRIAPDVPADVTHYRQYRGRLHFGHRPHRRSMFMPLNSHGLDRVYDRPSISSGRQVYFDIMGSLAPGLMSMRYDTAAKSPEPEILENLTRVDADSAVSAGRVFTGPDDPPRPDDNGPSTAALWIDEAEAALRRPEVRELMTDQGLQSARTTVAGFRATGKRLRPKDPGALALSAAMAASFAIGD